MSTRIGAPPDRVLRVLLDGYAEQLPETLRRRLEQQVGRHGHPRRPQ